MCALLGLGFLTLLCLVFTLFCLNFDPERMSPGGEGLAISPADGKVCFVGLAVDPLSPQGEERMRISVFMNVFNVHVNRVPVSGTVIRTEYYPGRFLNAALDKASEHNERLALAIDDEQGARWTVVQIAGLIARRIVRRAQPGGPGAAR